MSGMYGLRSVRYVAVAAALLASSTACSSGSSKAEGPASTAAGNRSVDVSGMVFIDGTTRQNDDANSECWTSGNRPLLPTRGDFDDIKEGAQVVVTNDTGKTVGVGELSPGQVQGGGSRVCTFRFTVNDVPADGKFYKITVGDHSQQVTASELASPTLRFP